MAVGLGCLLACGCGKSRDQARSDQEKHDEAAEAQANKALESVDHDVAARLYGQSAPTAAPASPKPPPATPPPTNPPPTSAPPQ